MVLGFIQMGWNLKMQRSFRDLSWIESELEKAYNQGRRDQIFFEKSEDKD